MLSGIWNGGGCVWGVSLDLFDSRGNIPPAIRQHGCGCLGRQTVSLSRYMALEVTMPTLMQCNVSEMVMEEQKWADVFSHLQVWTGQELACERIVWMKIFGVPVHLSSVGKLLVPSQASFDDGSIVNDTVGLILSIQETQLENLEAIPYERFWGDSDFDYYRKEGLGAFAAVEIIAYLRYQIFSPP
ncbi:hypothetical protein L1987_81176 [Smallanthus sonchifolius]|uniref:Uncharacterized protein n=1 Tax=Smallanthus sonchifolius TaxID=185202 RepID=A0ACB8YP11_9ASTR|nr:hypothetical protein L1987_81176 [Smallanthus sonchifolius]